MAVELGAVSPSALGITNESRVDDPTGPQLPQWAHTVSGSSTLLLVCVSVGTLSGYSDANTVTVSFGASAMTSVTKVHTNNATAGFIQLFALLGAAGTKNIAVTVTGSYHTDITAVALSFTGVDQLTPLDAASTNYGEGTSAGFAGAITSSINDMVMAFQGNGRGAFELSCSGVTERFNITTTNVHTACNSMAGGTVGGAASVTPAFTLDGSDWWAAIAVNINTMNEGTPPQLVHSPIARYYG